MNLRGMPTSSRGKKILFAIVSFSIIGFGYVFGDKVWLKQGYSLDQLKAAINEDPLSVDITEASGDNIAQEGNTGLMICAQFGYVDQAKEFMRRKASLDIRSKGQKMRDDELAYGNTALHYAIANGNDLNCREIAKLFMTGLVEGGKLVSERATVTIPNGKGYTPYHLLVSRPNVLSQRFELMKVMMQAAGNKYVQMGLINAQNDEGNTALHISAQTNDMGWIAMIIKEYGSMIKFDIKNKKGMLAEDEVPGFGGDLKRRLGVMREKAEAMRKGGDAVMTEEQFKNLNFYSF